MNKLKKKHNFDEVDNSIQDNENTKDENDLEKKIFVDSENDIKKKEIIFDVPVNLTVELGKSKIKIRKMLFINIALKNATNSLIRRVQLCIQEAAGHFEQLIN